MPALRHILSGADELQADNDQGYLETDACVDGENSSRKAGRQFVSRKVMTVGIGIVLLLGCAIGVSYMQGQDEVESDSFDMTTFYEILDRHPNLKNLNYSASGLPVDDVSRIRQLFHVKKFGVMHESTADLKTASCVVDITHSVLFLQRAALAITAATASCKGGKDPNIQAACAADISTVYAAVGFVAEYISQAVASCSENIQVDAQCSAAISGIVGNTARISTDAAFIAGNCKGAAAYGKPTGDSIWQMTRRLRSESSEVIRRLDSDTIEPTYEENTVGTYACVLDATQATNYLAAFGIAIDGATKSCSKNNLPHGIKSMIRYPFVHQMAEVYCAANIFDILEALFEAAAFISSAVSHCAPATNQDALCAAGATGVVGGSSGLLKSILFTMGACDKGMKVKGEVVSDVVAAGAAVRAWNALPAWKKKSAKFGAKQFFREEMKKAKKAVGTAKADVELVKENPVKAAKKASKIASESKGKA